MATVTKNTKITITLVMDEVEAKFLRDYTQNFLEGDTEFEHDRIIRESIFNAIDTGLKKRK